MATGTRRQFVVRGVAAGVAMGALRGQTPQPVPIPGLEVGEPTRQLVLRNVTIIDVTGQLAMPGMTVVITGNRIKSVGRTSAPSGVPAVDATGKFLIPGLWDMHVHQIDPLFVANGVVGVRVMGGSQFEVREMLRRRAEVAEGKSLGPRLAVASQRLGGNAVRNPAQGIAAVRDAVHEGVDFIKVYDNLSPESYFAVADEAKKLRVPFAGHVPNPPGLEACANAGQKSFEHMADVRRYLARVTGVAPKDLRPSSLSSSQAAALCAPFLRNQAWLCPTLTTAFGLAGDPSLGRDPRLKYFDYRMRAIWAVYLKNPNLAESRRIYEVNLGLVGAMHKAGVGILAGTDLLLGPYSTPGVLPGFGLHNELRHLVTAGLSPRDALRTATYNPAKYLGLLDSFGAVETGKLAELVLLDANPLDDIANTTKINMVLTGGRVYRRHTLDSMLNAVEANVKNALRLSQDVLIKYVGSYEFNAKEVGFPGPEIQLLKITLEEDVLWLSLSGSKNALLPISETTFTGFGYSVEFAKNDKGDVTQLLFRLGEELQLFFRSNRRDIRADRKD